MKIRNKNNGIIIDKFPEYDDFDGFWGYFIVTHDLKVLFFYSYDDTSSWDDVTERFEIIEENE